ncbi:MAG: hypothetical protein P4L46_19860 [Fimbriimonas sp.]|nr:hypothetical protein [Fimbriimonas sp.]
MDPSYRSRFLSYIGLAVVCVFAAIPLQSASHVMSDALVLGSGLLFVGAIVVGVKGRLSRYDLSELEKFDASERQLRSEPGVPGEFDSAYCMVCGEAYDMRLAYCPRCKSPQGGAPCG